MGASAPIVINEEFNRSAFFYYVHFSNKVALNNQSPYFKIVVRGSNPHLHPHTITDNQYMIDSKTDDNLEIG